MPSHKTQHTSESIKREISSIIRELNDPRVRNNFIDVVKIDISKDLSSCHVFISSLDGIERAKEAVEGLSSAVPYIKRGLSQRLELRSVPNIVFKATDSIEYSMNMIEKINSLNLAEDDKE